MLNRHVFASLAAAATFAVVNVAARADDPGTGVAIGPPVAVATDAAGNVYFSSPSIVYRLDAKGGITRFAGTPGADGYAGDGGRATDALLDFPASYPELAADPIDFGELVAGLATDPAGNVYIGDAYNSRVRRVDTGAIITTVAGNGRDLVHWATPDGGDGGFAKDAQITWPQGVAVDAAGNLYAASSYGTVRKVTVDGVIRTIAGPVCGPGFAGDGICGPNGSIAVDVQGRVYVADGYCRVRRIAPDGAVVTVAGDQSPDGHGYAFTCGHTRDSGPATQAALAWPYGVAIDGDGRLLIADTYNHCIRRVDGAGDISTIAGTCGQAGFAGDGGQAAGALLDEPHGVAADAKGNLYIADTANRRIRRVAPDGTITTVAGNDRTVPDPIAVTTGAVPRPRAVEFYHAAFDHYFVTADPGEIADILAGSPDAWEPTGESFAVASPGSALSVGVCRFFSPYFVPKSSHFYTADAGECAALKGTTNWQFEGEVFNVALPTADGSCAPGTLPLYRLYNNGQGGAPNHRYTTSLSIRATMVDRGWIPEGAGAYGVVACVPDP